MPAAERYAASTARLASRTAAGLLRLWDSLDSWTVEDSLAFHAAARPVVRSSATAALDLTRAYASTLTDQIDAPSELIVDDAVARIWDPFDRGAGRLAAGADWAEAAASAREAARALGQDTVYRTARQSIAEMVNLPGGWVRLVTGRSCNWCMSLSSVTFPTAAAATFGHSHCDCLPVPAGDGHEANARTRASAGWDDQAEARWDARADRRRLAGQERTARRHQEQARVEQLTETDPARLERLSIREQEWETRAERAAERLRFLETGSRLP